jgi:hypothetical protein
MSPEHFPVRWTRLTVKKCGKAKKRAAATQVEAALEHFPVRWIRL